MRKGKILKFIKIRIQRSNLCSDKNVLPVAAAVFLYTNLLVVASGSNLGN